MPAFGSESDIHQGLIIQQIGENRNEIRLMIVPPQTELLHRHCDRLENFLYKVQLQYKRVKTELIEL